MGIKPNLIKLSINMIGQEQEIGVLSLKPHNNTMSYHFRFPSGMLKEQFDLDASELGAGFDHVTWHSDVTHLKKSDNVLIGQIDDIFVPQAEEIKPILVESFYLNGGQSHLVGNDLQSKEFRSATKQTIGQITTMMDFSLIFILIPVNFALEGCFVQLPSKKLEFSLYQLCTTVGRVQVFDGFDLLVCTTPYTPNILHAGIVGPQRAINFQNPSGCINRILERIVA